MAIARDQYIDYYAEKLWEWLPAVYREQDALNGGDSLRAFLRAVAEQAAVAKRSQDRLWDDVFVELASDWAIPYISQLVATRLVSSLNLRGRRVDTAKTIYYRRRKGTLMVQEQLVSDIAGWDSKVVEEFKRLARTWHMLDCPLTVGRLTKTPKGGIADIRSPRGSRLACDAFDEFHYTPETRNPSGLTGRRGIETVSYHIYRLQPVTFNGVQPRRFGALADGRDQSTFDPSGRDIALFSGNALPVDWNGWQTAAEWELPRPISCRLLAEEIFEITAEEVAWVLTDAPIAGQPQREAAAIDLTKLIGESFYHRRELIRLLNGMPSSVTLTAPGVLAGLLSRALVRACGSAALLPNGADNAPWPVQNDPQDAAYGLPALTVGFAGVAEPVGRPRTRAANLEAWNPPNPADVDLFVSPETGRLVLNRGGNTAQSVRVSYQVGMLAPVGAGAFSREASIELPDVTWQNSSVVAGTPADGIAEVVDSRTYGSPQDQLAVINTRVRAREGQRPYFILRQDWLLTSAQDDAVLELDGLWLGSRTPNHLILDGNYERVLIRYCSFDPGGDAADGSVLPAVDLIVRGFVENLIIEKSMLGIIRLDGADASIEKITIIDSILQTRDAASVVIDALTAELRIERSTIITPSEIQLAVDVERLYASDTLVAGLVDVTDNQNGCFRFSAAASGSRVAKPYRSVFLQQISGLFISTRFGDHQYAHLTPQVYPQVLVGGEQGVEMGVFNQVLHEIKLRGAHTKVMEYLPFGRTPNFIIEN
ncbi:hypothetical protein [Aliikangiella coralliicola]|uniref:Uncharacterized protein n=1 Tax=Aliikangiella coralliicola TaxID=2592383 RepID=A0A545UE71_9GAMM|nr:hypothetical protein [Aliikangiella coralliicola]TQV87758.1 hypothetical protein FLL46_10250 [Aliikangiella coralliicola]